MKKTIFIVILIMLVGGGAFYVGVNYGQNKISIKTKDYLPGDFQGLSLKQQQSMKEVRQGLARMGTGLLNGEVIAKDEESITVKVNDGGSKIIFYSDSTEIKKITEVSAGNIKIGEWISIVGSQNVDGSYTAKSVQIGMRQPQVNNK